MTQDVEGSIASPLLSGLRFLQMPGGVLNVKTGEFISVGKVRRRREREERVFKLSIVLDADAGVIEKATRTYSIDGLEELYRLAAEGTLTLTDGQFVSR